MIKLSGPKGLEYPHPSISASSSSYNLLEWLITACRPPMALSSQLHTVASYSFQRKWKLFGRAHKENLPLAPVASVSARNAVSGLIRQAAPLWRSHVCSLCLCKYASPPTIKSHPPSSRKSSLIPPNTGLGSIIYIHHKVNQKVVSPQECEVLGFSFDVLHMTVLRRNSQHQDPMRAVLLWLTSHGHSSAY